MTTSAGARLEPSSATWARMLLEWWLALIDAGGWVEASLGAEPPPGFRAPGVALRLAGWSDVARWARR